MTRIDFYHLQKTSTSEALPQLLEKAYSTGTATIIKVGNKEYLDTLNSDLWTYDDTSFLPHGAKSDGNAKLQPIWLTIEDDNPNSAKFLFLVDGAEISDERFSEFDRIFNLFDGNSKTSLTQARNFWKRAKSLDCECNYWQQTDNGSWQRKA